MPVGAVLLWGSWRQALAVRQYHVSPRKLSDDLQAQIRKRTSTRVPGGCLCVEESRIPTVFVLALAKGQTINASRATRKRSRHTWLPIFFEEASFRAWVNYGGRMSKTALCTPERRSFDARAHATSVRARVACRLINKLGGFVLDHNAA